MCKTMLRSGQYCWEAPLTRQQQLACHASQPHRQGPGRCGQYGRAVAMAGHCCGEFAVRDGVWRHCIHRSPKRFIAATSDDDVDEVRHRNPTHPLPPVAEATSEAEPKEWFHAGQCAAGGREHHAHPKRDSPCSGLLDGFTRSLPRVGQPGEKALATRRLFGQNFVTPIAVPADRGSLHKGGGWVFKLLQGLDQKPRAIDAASEEHLPPRCRPATIGNAGSCEVDNGIEFFKARIRREGTFGIPPHLICRSRHVPDQPQDAGAAFLKSAAESRSDQSRAAGDGNRRVGTPTRRVQSRVRRRSSP